MISVKNLRKNFGSHQAVADVSFDVQQGDTLVLLGTSGCGKTTTLKMLNRLIEPDGGTVLLDGEDAKTSNIAELRRGIGYVLQDVALLPHYTVAQNIAIVPQLLGWQPAAIRQRTVALLEKLHLSQEYLNVYPDQLSGGQQQRVGIARALAANPPVLLMDEPFSALDPLTRAAIRQDFKELDELNTKTTVLVTHDVAEAVDMGDVICLMDAGRVVQIGTPRELLFSPQTDYVKRFFQDQRLQLQYKVTLLADLRSYLPATDNAALDNVSAATSLQDALSKIDEGHAAFHVESEGGMKLATPETLMGAFQQYKQSFSR